MNARGKILNSLKNKERDVTHPPAWRSRRNYNNLADQFTEALTKAKGEVHRAKNLAEATEQLANVLEDLNAEKIVANDVAPLHTLNLETRWPNLHWHVVDKTTGNLRDFCAAADVGLSSAEAALAETGSIVVTSGSGKSRLATLLPTAHVALVPTSKLTPDIFTWAASRSEATLTDDDKMPANLVLVSGPSKTADIEQTMAVGVHGPKRFIVILYND